MLVVDSHYVPRGNASVFHRPHYTFDVGLHYIGDCGPGGAVPRILHAAGVRDLTFNELDPEGFDTICLPDCTFRVPKGIDAFRGRLIARFPLVKRAASTGTSKPSAGSVRWSRHRRYDVVGHDGSVAGGARQCDD